MEKETIAFHTGDYVVFAFMLLFSALIGIYFRLVGGKQRTSNEYFLADSQMGMIPVAFSLMASFMSAITLLGVSSENYMRGTQFVVINIAYIIGTPIAAYIFLPVFFRARSASAFEYLEHRFSKVVRLTAGLVFMLQMILYMSVVLYAPALALSAVTGLNKWISVLSVGLVCTFYSSIGGIKAVLLTDVFQSVLMFSAIYAVIIKGTMDVGSLSEVWRIAEEGGRIEFLNYDPDPTVRHTIWSLGIGGIFTFVAVYGVNQTQVQRLLTIGDLKRSQMALYLHLPILCLLSFSTSFAGLVVYANFYNCDPMLRANVTSVKQADQLLPYFVMKSLGSVPGLPGLFVAGIFSGALSTMSSAINSLAAVTYEDFIHPFCLGKLTNRSSVTLVKLIAIAYGAVCMALTYVVDQIGAVLQASLTILNVTGGPLLGLFSLGMMCRRAKSKGSLIGFIVALLFGFWIAIGAQVSELKPVNLKQSITGCPSNVTSTFFNVTSHSLDLNEFSDVTTLERFFNSSLFQASSESEVFPLYKLSYMWYALIGWVITVFVGLIGSLIPGDNKAVDPKYLSPVVSRGVSKRKAAENRYANIPMTGTHL